MPKIKKKISASETKQNLTFYPTSLMDV